MCYTIDMINNFQNSNNQITDLEDHKLLAALSYLGVLVLVPLLVGRHHPFVFWHAKQGLIILIGEVIALIAGSWSGVAGSLLFVLMLVASVVGLLQALLGRRWQAPLIGWLAQQFKI